MPLIQIRHNLTGRRWDKQDAIALSALRKKLPSVAAKALSCGEGGVLAPEDIMIEIDSMSGLDVNEKDIHIRVWAHDYLERREKLDAICSKIQEVVSRHLPVDMRYYVWVFLIPTSYCSGVGMKPVKHY